MIFTKTSKALNNGLLEFDNSNPFADKASFSLNTNLIRPTVVSKQHLGSTISYFTGGNTERFFYKNNVKTSSIGSDVSSPKNLSVFAISFKVVLRESGDSLMFMHGSGGGAEDYDVTISISTYNGLHMEILAFDNTDLNEGYAQTPTLQSDRLYNCVVFQPNPHYYEYRWAIDGNLCPEHNWDLPFYTPDTFTYVRRSASASNNSAIRPTFYNERLSYEEAAFLSKDTDQIFKSRRPIIYSFGATALPTLTLPGVQDVGPTSARPKVTRTFA